MNTAGLYFTAGIPVTYSTETRLPRIVNIYEDPVHHSHFTVTTIAGFGLKHPLSKRIDFEMNMNISPNINFVDVDYGTSGFVKSGFKLSVKLGDVKSTS